MWELEDKSTIESEGEGAGICGVLDAFYSVTRKVVSRVVSDNMQF